MIATERADADLTDLIATAVQYCAALPGLQNDACGEILITKDGDSV